MWIELGNLKARVLKATRAESDWLHNYLSFPDAKAAFRSSRIPAWKRGDGKIHMLEQVSQTFPAGFIDIVVASAAKDGHRVEVVDKRVKPAADPRALLDWLRPYQTDAVAAAKKHERGIFHHVTGAGKTEVMVALAEVYPVRWLVLTHKLDLIAQTAKRFGSRTGEEVGKIGEGSRDLTKRITIATFQSIVAALRSPDKRVKAAMQKHLLSIQGVMVDEAHVVGSDLFWKVTMSTPNAYFRYGFSATPFARGDKRSVFIWGALGPIIHRVAAEQLIALGVLAKPTIRMLSIKHPAVKRGGTWSEAESELIVHSKARNALVLQAASVATKPCLLFVRTIEHGRLLEKLLAASGTKTEFAWGNKSTAQRQAAIRRLVHGDTDVLVCNVIFQEGIDIPELQSVVVAQGGKSTIAALQRVGRGMRRHASNGDVTKTEFTVFDIKDAGCGCTSERKHASCKWMEQHSRDRVRAYGREKYLVVDGLVGANLATSAKRSAVLPTV